MFIGMKPLFDLNSFYKKKKTVMQTMFSIFNFTWRGLLNEFVVGVQRLGARGAYYEEM